MTEFSTLPSASNTISMENGIQLNTIEEAIADIKAGKIIIVVDDEDRENEGDFICAAAQVTPEIINFMAMHGRGLICAPLEEKRADELGLNLMVSDNTALHETAFTVSIDLIGNGCTTGISAYDRATCVRALVNPKAKASDFAKPGHIFPLRAKTGGVLRRTGHTEAAIDLAKLAGFAPAGVLVEILNEDGTMARLPQLFRIAQQHDLKIITIKDLVAYRMRTERLIKREINVPVKTKFGDFELIAYTQITTGDTHLAVKKGSWLPDEPVLVRVFSNSEGRNLLGTLFDKFRSKNEKFLEMIANEGKGALIFMRHKEKGDSVLSQLKTLKRELEGKELSAKDRPTEMDQRDYGTGAQIIRDLGIEKIRLISNNPKRRVGMIGFGLEILELVGW